MLCERSGDRMTKGKSGMPGKGVLERLWLWL